MRSLVELVRRTAARKPGAIAVADRTATLSWNELAGAVARGALRLRAQGIAPGDRVLLALDRTASFVPAYFAVHAAGAVAVIVAHESPAYLEPAVALAEVRLAITAGDELAPQPSISTASLFAPGPEHGAWADPAPGDLADLVFTTGSTGAPKGVELTHGNLASIGESIASYLGQHEASVEVCPLPLSHSFGLGRVRAMAHAGSTLVVEPGLRAIGELLAAVSRHRATCASLPPAAIAMLERLRADRELAALAGGLAFVELGSAPLAARLRDWLCDRLPGVRLCHHYGLTEASRAAFVELASDDARAGSIGRAVPGVTIESREGELWIRGPNVARAYWRATELTAATFVDGWVRTDDLGRVDADGRIFLTGRSSELIHVGGIKIAPEEIEAAIAAHPDVTDVACTAIADPQGITGERVAAFVVAERALELADLRAWLGARGFDGHRLPVYVERVAALPRAPSGKLLRRTLTRSR